MKLHETNSYSELHSKFPRHSYRQVIRIRIKCKFDKFVSRNSSRRKGRNELKIIQIRMTNSLKKFREKKSRRIFRIHATREYTCWLVFPSDTIPKPILTCITKWHWSLTPHRERSMMYERKEMEQVGVPRSRLPPREWIRVFVSRRITRVARIIRF